MFFFVKNNTMIGYKIKKLREERNMSRDEMAALINKDVRTYGKIETNERKPTLDEIEIISKHFQVNPEDLLYAEPKIVFESCNNNQYVGNNGVVNIENKDLIKLIDTLCKTLESCQQFIIQQSEWIKDRR